MNTDRFRHNTAPPREHYVYAYMCPRTNKTLYVGQGFADLGHLERLGVFCTERRNPIVCIVKDGLTEEEAVTSEQDLNKLLAL
jgi:hypothetical protein